MNDWRGEERHESPHPPVHPHVPFSLKTMLPLLSQRTAPFSSTICWICLVKSLLSSAYLWLWSSAATYRRPLSIHLQLVSLMAVSPSWQEEPPGSGFLLLFHIICLDITATLPGTRGIITIFQYKRAGQGERLVQHGVCWWHHAVKRTLIKWVKWDDFLNNQFTQKFHHTISPCPCTHKEGATQLFWDSKKSAMQPNSVQLTKLVVDLFKG